MMVNIEQMYSGLSSDRCKLPLPAWEAEYLRQISAALTGIYEELHAIRENAPNVEAHIGEQS